MNVEYKQSVPVCLGFGLDASRTQHAIKMVMAYECDANIGDGYAKQAIEDAIKDLKIKNHKLTVDYASAKGENYLGILYRILVEGEDENGDEVKRNFILKLPLDSVVMREKFPVEKMYKREVSFYTDVLADVDKLESQYDIPETERLNVPFCFKADGEVMKEYLLLEDMGDKGYAMANRRFAMNLDQVKSVLQNLARFHAVSFKFKKCQPETFRKWFDLCDDYEDYKVTHSQFPQFLVYAKERTLSVLKDEKSIERLKAFGDVIEQKYEDAVTKVFDKPYSVVCHGDCWTNNVLFQYKDEKVTNSCLIDWQILKYGSPVIDVSHFLCMTTDEKFRKDHFQEMLEWYYSCLKDRLQDFREDIEDIFPKSVFDEHVKSNFYYGVTLTMMILPMLLGEVEDIPDMDELLQAETIDMDTLKISNEQASNRYEIRINGLLNDAVRMGFI